MISERVQRQIDRLLDDAEAAMAELRWETVRDRTRAALALDADNADAATYLASAEKALNDITPHLTAPSAPSPAPDPRPPVLTSFANGRYEVRRFLGEGGKKKVYLAKDTLLDRDVAFALIKTEGLDAAARERITREAQAMGRLGDHPHIVTVYDIGEENSQPYMVLPVLPGGDVEGLIEKAADHKLDLPRALKIAIQTCRGLEFAHGRGIIHRDLKPGNVWLTEDGSAKIGDFGLAVATDRSRLTQAGMMVGTVSYMPPEQAMGGEVGPRSDLYSLGAMLYEMVCGRPPFVGDESVAIIGQHLNTPPVSPTWHRPDCPPALESLILRLLEKDPGRRPENASVVREALESIGQSDSRQGGATGPAGTQPPAPDTPGAPDPLYRRTFVGRESEVRQLQQAFDGAVSGNGALVMVVGEPGIGKTALCEQLATYVALRGGKALVGHCYEEGSLSLPYLAFVEAMRSYVLAREPDGLRTDLGTGAADVARIVSEVRDRVQGVELRPAGDPEDDRWRLLQAVTGFLRNASSVQPMAIILEDLHWADRGTLDLLLHVARNLQGTRLLIIGTYRDVEVDRTHPLSATLAELRRQERFLRVPLRGLTVDEVHRMYESLRGNDVPWAQAEALHRQTEGNPLFIQEVIRYLVEEGFVVREGGRWVLAEGTQPGTGLPEGLRDVVGRRLSRLSDACNRLLAVAAVIGRDFDLATLRSIANVSEDDLLAGIEEAVKVGVLEERSLPGALRYRFAHAFFRTALYEEMIAARRLRLHQEVARALEAQYATRREEHAAELAEHYGQSTDRADLAKAVEYSEIAAKRAMSVFAYAEAEQHLRRCIEVQQVLNPDDNAKRCDLLLALGEAMLPQEDPGRVLASLSPEAFALAEHLSDASRAARVAVQACEAIWRAGLALTMDELLRREWVARADQYAIQGSVERVYADVYRGLETLRDSREEAHAFLRKAVERSLELEHTQVFFAAAGWALNNLLALRDRELVERIVGEVLSRPRAGVRTADLWGCLRSCGVVLLERGDRHRAETVWDELARLTEHTRDATATVEFQSNSIRFAMIDGRLDDAIALFDAQRAASLGTGSGLPIGAGSGGAQVLLYARVLYYQGKSAEQTLELLTSPTRPSQALGATIRSFLGRFDEAHEVLRLFPGIESLSDETAKPLLVCLLEISVLSSNQGLANSLIPRLSPLANTLDIIAGVSVGRILGEASRMLGQGSEARSYHANALELCERVRFRPEIALIRLDLAELLLEHYPEERDIAIEHLDFAIEELRQMKMQPALERALRHRGLLKA